MNLIRLVIELFVLYLLYKLVFDLIIPMYKAGKQIKKKMEEVRANMEEEEGKTPAPSAFKDGEYIDFEEVK
jgi:flagellar biosynthesis protein FlhB